MNSIQKKLRTALYSYFMLAKYVFKKLKINKKPKNSELI